MTDNSPLSDHRRPRPSRTPDIASTASRPCTSRRRDGVALAATGRIPDRVRAAVLAERHAELARRSRDSIRDRINRGTFPLPIPHGYQLARTEPPTTTCSVSPETGTAQLEGRSDNTTGVRGRGGRAPAALWVLDPATDYTVRLMFWWALGDITPANIAIRLNAEPACHPLPRTASGTPQQRWTSRMVAGLLTDPLYTGHSVWGRTHRGRPRPRSQWIISLYRTHPPLVAFGDAAALHDRLTRRAGDEPGSLPTGP